MMRSLLGLFFIPFGTLVVRAGDDAIPAMFAERTATVVSVSYTIQREIDRQQIDVVGLVVDDEGLVVLPGPAFADWLPPERVKELRVHLPSSVGDGFEAAYLGQDYLNGWHYVRAEEAAREAMRPITDFPSAVPVIGEALWGICLTDENLDFLPYFRDGRLSASQGFPLLTGFATADLAAPGAPVFNGDGAFVGWTGRANPVEREMWIGGEVYRVNIRNNVESHTFLYAADFLENVGRVPPSVTGAPRPWLGIAGLRPIDRDTAEFLGLENQGAVIVSEVIQGSPAEAAGFEPRDIVVGIAGQRFERYKPDAVVQTVLERAIRGSEVGGELAFSVMRGEEDLELVATFSQGPKIVREAERQYFDDLGFTVRELVMADALQRRVDFSGMKGVLAAFVKPESPPNAAGLQPGDWILEVDNTPIEGYADGLAAFERIQADTSGAEYLLLVSRHNETSLLRVRRD